MKLWLLWALVLLPPIRMRLGQMPIASSVSKQAFGHKDGR
jgi:hypothetical protein